MKFLPHERGVAVCLPQPDIIPTSKLELLSIIGETCAGLAFFMPVKFGFSVNTR